MQVIRSTAAEFLLLNDVFRRNAEVKPDTLLVLCTSLGK